MSSSGIHRPSGGGRGNGGVGAGNSGNRRRNDQNDRPISGRGYTPRNDASAARPDSRGPPGSNRRSNPTPGEAGLRAARPAAGQVGTSGGSKLSQERLIFAFHSLIGHTVQVQTKNGTVYEGIFHTAQVDRDVSVVLQMVHTLHDGAATGKPPPPGTVLKKPRVTPTKSMIIPAKDFVQVVAKDVTLNETVTTAQGPAGELSTDGNLSKNTQAGLIGRDLVAWLPDEDLGSGLIDDSADRMDHGGGGGSRGWNQFEINRDKFGVISSFDENLYTTSLDPGNAGITEAEAERIAREIERSSTSNPHLAEERGQKIQDEAIDEEDRFSSVIRPGEDMPSIDNNNDETFGDAGAGPASSQDDVNREHMRIRLHLGAKGTTKQGSPGGSARSPLTSPLVGNPEQISALNLEPALPQQVSPEVIRDFQEFKLEKSGKTSAAAGNTSRTVQTNKLRSFSASLQIGEGEKAPSPPKPGAPDDAGAPSSSTTPSAPAPAPLKPTGTGTIKPGMSTLKSTLNPNAKPFSFNVSAPAFVPGGAPRASPAPAKPAPPPAVPPSVPPPAGPPPPPAGAPPPGQPPSIVHPPGPRPPQQPPQVPGMPPGGVSPPQPIQPMMQPMQQGVVWHGSPQTGPMVHAQYLPQHGAQYVPVGGQPVYAMSGPPGHDGRPVPPGQQVGQPQYVMYSPGTVIVASPPVPAMHPPAPTQVTRLPAYPAHPSVVRNITRERTDSS